jgi:hypothetical protein
VLVPFSKVLVICKLKESSTFLLHYADIGGYFQVPPFLVSVVHRFQEIQCDGKEPFFPVSPSGIGSATVAWDFCSHENCLT